MKTMVNDFFKEFHIGAYFLQPNARTEAHVRDMKECGIDLIFGINYDPAILDLLYQYQISAVVFGIVPGWFGGNGDNAGTMRHINKRDDYVKALNAFEDHPAIVGINIGDEPSSIDFPYYGEVIKLIRELLPNKFPYLNIYPSYGMLATNSDAQIQKELGTHDYKGYIDAYFQNIDLPYLSFDHYVYSSDVDRLLGDLSINASYCKTLGKKLYVVMQVNSREEDIFISEEQLCFQAYCALAYGACAVSWACYSAGWWYHPVLDADGNRTEQYEKLKKVNQKVRSLASEYIKYQWVSAEKITGGTVYEFDVFKSIVSSQDALLGKFEKADGRKALFVSLLDCQFSVHSTFSFRLNRGKRAYLYMSDGSKCELVADNEGVCRVTLNGSEACFITID